MKTKQQNLFNIVIRKLSQPEFKFEEKGVIIILRDCEKSVILGVGSPPVP